MSLSGVALLRANICVSSFLCLMIPGIFFDPRALIAKVCVPHVIGFFGSERSIHICCVFELQIVLSCRI